MLDKTTETPVCHDDTIERLRAWVALADKQANEHATRGGEARALANQHLADAARHTELAAQERAIADERRWLLAVAEATRPPADAQPMLLAAPEPVQVAPPEGFRSQLPTGLDPMGVLCPAECGQQVFAGPNGPVHLIEGGTVAVCRPMDQESTGVFPRVQVEAAL